MSPESELDEMTNKRVLDPCSGGRSMWFDRNHPDVVFGDVRSEPLTVTDNSRGNPTGQRTLRIEPDVRLDVRDLPYAYATFRSVAFALRRLVHARPHSWLEARYGRLGTAWCEDGRSRVVGGRR